MHLVQILLPIVDRRGSPPAATLYETTRLELIERFGGLTAYSRAPAKGFWKDEGRTERDDVIVLEVMAAALDRAWWRAYRRRLETRFAQEEVIVRALAMERL